MRTRPTVAAIVVGVVVLAAACAQVRGGAPGAAALPAPEEWPAELRFVPCQDVGDDAVADCATAYAVGPATYEVPWCVPLRSPALRSTVVATGAELGRRTRATLIEGHDPDVVLALEAPRDCGDGREVRPVLMFGRRALTTGDLTLRLACELGDPDDGEVAFLCVAP